MKVKTKYGEHILACFVPPKGSGWAVTCHEKTLCDCEVIELIDRLKKEIKELRDAWSFDLSAIEGDKE